MTDKEDDQKPKNRLLGALYSIGKFAARFLILANIFGWIFGPHILIFVAVIIWELSFVKGAVIGMCKEYLPDWVTQAVTTVSDCFAYLIESLVWIFYNSLRCAYALFCILFWITVVVGGIKFAIDFNTSLAK